MSSYYLGNDRYNLYITIVTTFVISSQFYNEVSKSLVPEAICLFCMSLYFVADEREKDYDGGLKRDRNLRFSCGWRWTSRISSFGCSEYVAPST